MSNIIVIALQMIYDFGLNAINARIIFNDFGFLIHTLNFSTKLFKWCCLFVCVFVCLFCMCVICFVFCWCG